ncbi:MAG: TraB/GumN family protein [Cryomorphaceae bacterium]
MNSAQSDYELLWRIDGKDLDKSSFLFGTMHIADERAYKFSDSVLLAFESAEILAKELSRSDVFEAAIENRFSKKQNSAFKEQFEDQEYAQIREAFQKRTKLDLDKIDNANPLLINQLLRESGKKEDDSSLLILDEYFEECALKMDKRVVGLEEPFDGIRSGQGFTNSFEKEFFKMRLLTNLDSVFEMYDKKQNNGFISEANRRIESYREGKLPTFNLEEDLDAMSTFDMKDRNVKMVQGLDSIMKMGGVFCAVGASHLPGEYGMIEMLREKGYKVEVVQADFTGESKRLMKKYEKLPAGNIERLLQGYTVKMKGSAEDLQIPNSNLKMVFYQDTKTGMGQFTMVVEQSDLFSSPQENLDMIVENYRLQNNFEIKAVTDIKHRDLNGKQIEFSSPNGFDAVMWLFSTNGFAYIFMEMTRSLDDFKVKQSEFFQSIRFFPIDQLTTLSWDDEMSEIEELKMKINLPSPRHEMLNYHSPLELGSSEYMSYSTISAIDRVEMYSILLSQYSYPARYQPHHVEFVHSTMIDAQLEATDGVSIYKDTLYNDEQMYLYEILNIEDTGSVHVVSFVRGNIMNNLVLQTTGELNEKQTNFLMNWELTPWKQPQLSMVKNDFFEILGSGEVSDFDEHYSYSTWVDSAQYQSILDIESGISTDVLIYELNELTFFENEDSLVQEFFIDTAYTNLTSPLEKFHNGYIYSYEEEGSSVRSNVFLTWKNKQLYEIIHNTARDIDLSYADSVFSSFKIVADSPSNSFDIFESKETEVQSRLYSTDSTAYQSALSVSTEYKFSERVATEILTSLRDSTPPLFDDEWYYQDLIKNLYYHTSDTSLHQLKEIFKNNAKLESNVLHALSEISTDQSLMLYSELFKNKTSELTYTDFSGYHSKKELVKRDYPTLIDLVQSNKGLSSSVSILESYFEKEPEDQSLLSPYGGVFVDALEQILDTINPKAEYYVPVYTYTSMVELASYAGVPFKDMSGIAKSLGKIKNAEADALALLIEIGMGNEPKPSELEDLKSDQEKLGIFLLGSDILGPEMFFSLMSKEEYCKIQMENEFYYEDYGNIEIDLVTSFNYSFNDQELEIYQLEYTTDYSSTKELASCVLDKNSRLIYSTLYIGESNSSDLEKSKKLVIEDFEEYYVE